MTELTRPLDVIEFYLPGAIHPFKHVHSNFRVQRGDMISIDGSTYKVTFASYALDYSEQPDRRMRLNVTVVPEDDKQQRARLNKGSVTRNKTGP